MFSPDFFFYIGKDFAALTLFAFLHDTLQTWKIFTSANFISLFIQPALTVVSEELYTSSSSLWTVLYYPVFKTILSNYFYVFNLENFVFHCVNIFTNHI